MQRKVNLGEQDRTGTGCESEGGRVSHSGFMEPEWQWSDDLRSLHVTSIGEMPPSSSWKKCTEMMMMMLMMWMMLMMMMVMMMM